MAFRTNPKFNNSTSAVAANTQTLNSPTPDSGGTPPPAPNPNANVFDQPGPGFLNDFQAGAGSEPISGTNIGRGGKGPKGDPKRNRKGRKQAEILGEQGLGRFVPEQGALKKRDIPLLELRLNFENNLKAEQDREFARRILAQSFGRVGQSPELQQALAAIQQRLQNPGVFNEQQSSAANAAIRGRGQIGFEDAQRAIQQSFAQRGLVGSVSPLADARLRQGTARDVGAGLQDQLVRELLLRDQKEQQAAADLAAFGQSQEGRQLGISSELAQLFANTTRQPFDLGGATQGKGSRGGGGTFDKL